MLELRIATLADVPAIKELMYLAISELQFECQANRSFLCRNGVRYSVN